MTPIPATARYASNSRSSAARLPFQFSRSAASSFPAPVGRRKEWRSAFDREEDDGGRRISARPVAVGATHRLVVRRAGLKMQRSFAEEPITAPRELIDHVDFHPRRVREIGEAEMCRVEDGSHIRCEHVDIRSFLSSWVDRRARSYARDWRYAPGVTPIVARESRMKCAWSAYPNSLVRFAAPSGGILQDAARATRYTVTCDRWHPSRARGFILRYRISHELSSAKHGHPRPCGGPRRDNPRSVVDGFLSSNESRMVPRRARLHGCPHVRS
jgi:hypothetical protein